MHDLAFYVYILASKPYGTLYVGMTDDLIRRVSEHRDGLVPGFTKQYGVKVLVWYEIHPSRESAFARERAIKKWNRAWKIQMIEAENPRWVDLFPSLGV
jgi:putative endonuclease